MTKKKHITNAGEILDRRHPPSEGDIKARAEHREEMIQAEEAYRASLLLPLGTRLAKRFENLGLTEDIYEWRSLDPADAEELADSLEVIAKSEQEFRDGQGMDAREAIKRIAKKYGVKLD